MSGEPTPSQDSPFGNLKRVDVPTLDQERAAFRERIVGQEEAVESFASLLVKLRSGIRSQSPGPIDAKFLAGPIKEQVRKELTAELAYGGGGAFLRARDMYVKAEIGTVEEWNQLLNS